MSGVTQEPPVIHRHRTAMVRHDLSQPMALLVRHGLIKPGTRVFDYGCGQGDDLRILSARGISAAGWDPHFRPDAPRTPADVVNLGFVLNVIEHRGERIEALSGAWRLTERVLAVATMIAGQVPVDGLRPLGDGFVTSRGTFQKYFQHAELRDLIKQTLEMAPVAVAPGIFFIFRTPEDEQDFLLERRAGQRLSAAAYSIPRRERLRVKPARPELSERIPLALEDIRAFALRRGRLPQADELRPEVLEELVQQKVSVTRAIQACVDAGLDAQRLEVAAAARREDLLVHYALALLNRSASATRPSQAMVRDIRALFGSQKEVSIQAADYLHALANEDRVREAITKAEMTGLGVLDQRRRLVALGDRAEALPGLLRCYFGCAAFLAGEPQTPFLLRIDPARRRVAMWTLKNPKDALPLTDICIQVDLRRQDVHMRHDSRRLLRKGELEGLSPRTKQRQAEAAFRAANGMPAEMVFEKLDIVR